MTSATPIRDDARRVHDDAILIDGQGVTVLLPVAQTVPAPIDGVPYLDRAIAGGITAQNVTLGIGGIGMGTDDFRALLGTMHGHYCYFEIEPRLILVETAEDIRRAKREARLGVIFGVQGLATKIEDDPSLVRILHRLGLRIGQMTYNERSSLGCGCLEQPDTGLTQLGKIVVREMNHTGIAVDMAHAGDRTTLDAIDCSREPVVVSHGNARALCDTPRNYGDDALKAVRALTGGGADYAFEVYGSSETITLAFDMARKGGTAIIVGLAPVDDFPSIDPVALVRQEKTLKGAYYGASRPAIDFQRMVDLYASGKIDVDSLITRAYRLDQINDAYEELERGVVGRGVIAFS